jgi:hypothetical protein
MFICSFLQVAKPNVLSVLPDFFAKIPARSLKHALPVITVPWVAATAHRALHRMNVLMLIVCHSLAL